jgi:hypothetical protein
MSRRSCQATEAAIAVLAAIMLFSTTVRAADPNAPPAEKAKTQKATKPAPSKPAASPKRTPASFTPEMAFGEAIDILRNSTTPPLNIVVLWKEIGENADVYRETPIGIDGVGGLRVSQYLELLLLSLSSSASAKLGYTVKGGVITIGTTGSLQASGKVTRVYDVSDLVAEPANYFFSPMMGLGGMYGGMGYGNMGYGNMGYGGMYGGSMMAPGGYGYGASGGLGMYGPAGMGGIGRDQGLSNAISNAFGRTRGSNARRR